MSSPARDLAVCLRENSRFMTLGQDTRPERVKFIYNAQFPADTVVELNNSHFTVLRAE